MISAEFHGHIVHRTAAHPPKVTPKRPRSALKIRHAGYHSQLGVPYVCRAEAFAGMPAS